MSTKTLFCASAGFEAARRVEILPEGHRSRRLHGHSFLANVRCDIPESWADFPGGEVQKLRMHLEQKTNELDYRFLNDTLPHPTDENIARWLRSELDLPGTQQIGIQSTQHEGVDLDKDGHAHVWRRYLLQAAHRLPNVPIHHKCGRMHGHGFEVILHANQHIGSSDLSIDYDRLDVIWAPLHRQLNHTCLNDIPGLENPTSEVISSWIWDRLKVDFPELSWVTVFETSSCGASYDGQNYRIWKEMTLDSSLQLKRAPDNCELRKVHGHTYTMKLHLAAPLDTVMGWTVDFGDVKELFNPIFKRIDHQPLHEIPDLDDCDCASIAEWIFHQTQKQLPQLDRVDLYETRGCGVIISDSGIAPAMPI